jgi:hypothetical protein
LDDPVIGRRIGGCRLVRRLSSGPARLAHPSIIHIYDFGRTRDGTLYMVMEYLPGGLACTTPGPVTRIVR